MIPFLSALREFKSKILHSLLSTAYAILDHPGPLTGLSEIKMLRKMKHVSQRLLRKRNETIIITLDFLAFLVSWEYVTALNLIMPTLPVSSLLSGCAQDLKIQETLTVVIIIVVFI